LRGVRSARLLVAISWASARRSVGLFATLTTILIGCVHIWLLLALGRLSLSWILRAIGSVIAIDALIAISALIAIGCLVALGWRGVLFIAILPLSAPLGLLLAIRLLFTIG
jgi:hypothetical protein